jgi:hypothetical protein
MRIDGACHCGFIAFEAEADPSQAGICHCTDCQRLSGSPFRVSVAVPRAAFRLLAGAPAIYVKTADSGRRRDQAFCPRCGSPIYSTAHDDPDAPLNLRAGIVRQRDALVPTHQSWTRSRQRWLDDLPAIPGDPEE